MAVMTPALSDILGRLEYAILFLIYMWSPTCSAGCDFVDTHLSGVSAPRAMCVDSKVGVSLFVCPFLESTCESAHFSDWGDRVYAPMTDVSCVNSCSNVVCSC